MKKLLLFIGLPLILAACQTNNPSAHENRFDNNLNLENDLDAYNEHENRDITNCHTLCYDKVQEVCIDQIVAILDQGYIADGSLFNEEACAGMCESKWTDDTRECISKATKCESLSMAEPYCKEEEDNSIVEYEPEQEQKYACSKACYKYKECALLTDDATGKDGNEAYRTCYEECQNWSTETIDCVSNTETGTPMGCANMTACALKEYGGLLK